MATVTCKFDSNGDIDIVANPTGSLPVGTTVTFGNQTDSDFSVQFHNPEPFADFDLPAMSSHNLTANLAGTFTYTVNLVDDRGDSTKSKTSDMDIG